MKEIIILRYGHRHVRDFRVTSHCCLVARALGAKGIVICGEEDKKLVNSIKRVVRKWGGNFKIKFTNDWKKIIKIYSKKGFKSIHLTMYGQPIQDEIKELCKLNKVLIIIGSQKVEKGIYLKSNYNISITQQPHSEIAALSITLHELFEGKELNKKYSNAKINIIPQKKGKKTKKVD